MATDKKPGNPTETGGSKRPKPAFDNDVSTFIRKHQPGQGPMREGGTGDGGAQLRQGHVHKVEKKR